MNGTSAGGVEGFSRIRFGFVLALASATWVLLFIGAMVTSTNSGLSVPDWPTTYGQNMFLYPLSKMTGGIFYEHGHRLVASFIGFLVVMNALFVMRKEPRVWLRKLSWVALLVVILQGVLGGLTVRLKLPMPVSSSHAGLAELFFALVTTMASASTRTWIQHERRNRFDVSNTLFKVALALSGAIFAQIIVGAVMRHSYAGLAIPTFPKAFGEWVPAVWNFGIWVHFIHTRIIPVLILLLSTWTLTLSFRTKQKGPFRNWTWVLAVLLPLQILLGMTVIWSFKAPIITSIHLAFGAATFITALQIALWAGRSAGENQGLTHLDNSHFFKRESISYSTALKGESI